MADSVLLGKRQEPGSDAVPGVFRPPLCHVADRGLHAFARFGDLRLSQSLGLEGSNQIGPINFFHSDILSDKRLSVTRKSESSFVYSVTMSTDFGKRLVAAREHAGLTQQQLAAAVQISQSTLATAEKKGHGSRKCPQLAQACGVNPNWLATGEGEMVGDTPPPKKCGDLGEMLGRLGAELASMPEARRAEVADLMRAWVLSSGRPSYGALIQEAIATPNSQLGKRAA